MWAGNTITKNRVWYNQKRFLKNELLDICNLNNLATTTKIQKIEEGWVGKAKGMLQTLYERGYIDKHKISHPRSMSYSKIGKKWHYTNGELTAEGQIYSLYYLLSKCTDFQNEKSDLEHLCSDLLTSSRTITITFTPKFHCEIAGERIEYAWGLAKKYYRRIPYHQYARFPNS